MTTLRAKGSKNEIFQEVVCEILNPKCISMGELYGEFNELTQEWHDGLASTIMRRAAADESDVRKWTVFDGPIDALWIESMNTVLDDNMTLCLANGERIKLRRQMKMLFEVMDLAVASPATVSRIGVVFISPTDLGWTPYLTSWSQKHFADLDKELEKQIILIIETLSSSAFQLIYSIKNSEPVPTSDIQMIISICAIIQSLLIKFKVNLKDKVENLKPILIKIILFSFIW